MNEQDEVRGRILEAAYQDAIDAGGIAAASFMNTEVAQRLGLDGKRTRDALTSLKANGLLETVTAFLGGGELLRVTASGFQQIERLRDEGYKPAAPDAPTKQGNTYVTFNGSVYGQAIQGAGSTTNITQLNYAASSEALELIERIIAVAQGLEDDEVRAEAVESAEALESELRSEQPDPKRVRTLARGFWSVAQNAAALTTLGIALMKALGIG
jgi:hypothetical protein